MSTGALEEANYVDTGCPDGLHPSCLNCPLPRCRYEFSNADARRAQEARIRARRARQKSEVRQLIDGGMTAQEAAEFFGISIRSVYRRLSA